MVLAFLHTLPGWSAKTEVIQQVVPGHKVIPAQTRGRPNSAQNQLWMPKATFDAHKQRDDAVVAPDKTASMEFIMGGGLLGWPQIKEEFRAMRVRT